MVIKIIFTFLAELIETRIGETILEGIATGSSIFLAQLGVEKWKNSNYIKGTTKVFNYALKRQLSDLYEIRKTIEYMLYHVVSPMDQDRNRIAELTKSIRDGEIYKNQLENIRYFDKERQDVMADYAYSLENVMKDLKKLTSTLERADTNFTKKLNFLTNQIDIIIVLNIRTRLVMEKQADTHPASKEEEDIILDFLSRSDQLYVAQEIGIDSHLEKDRKKAKNFAEKVAENTNMTILHQT